MTGRRKTTMLDFPMPMLNRTALVVRPRQPFIEWANTLDDKQPKLDVNRPDWEDTVYLVSETDDGQGARRAIARHYKAIFEHELYSWHTDEQAWPRKRDLRTFRAWFEVTAHSIVVDLSHDVLAIEML
jgi:hypothetical protein